MRCGSSSSSPWCGGGARAPAAAAAASLRRSCSMAVPGRLRVPVRGSSLCRSEPPSVAAPADRRRRWAHPDGDWRNGRRRWIRQPELTRHWVEAEDVAVYLSESGSNGGGGADTFLIVSHNILGVNNALKHRDLYSNIPFDIMKWDRRKRLICQDIHNWNADIVCLQEVDSYYNLSTDLKREGYAGSFKRRTGDALDGCAIFWRENIFHLLEERNIEFRSFGLRDNVAQICIFEMCKANTKRLLVGNIHVLFNPNRGDIKLGQIRTLLWNSHALSEKWGGIPVVIAGDFNCTPQSAVYEFLSTSELKITMHDRKCLSGQNKCPTAFTWPRFCEYGWTNEELKNATGNWGRTQLDHPLKLQSAYASVKGTSRTRDLQGEPLATTYHSKFLGTVDYIWYSVGLSPLRVLDTMPIHALRKTGGLPCEKIGSDHLALASEFIFTEDKLEPEVAIDAKSSAPEKN